MSKKAVIFDLDGTLVNSLQDLADAVNHTMQTLGRPVHELSQYRYLVGQGLRRLIYDALGGDGSAEHDALTDRGIEIFHMYYDVHQFDHTDVYTGVSELLDVLTEHKVRLCVLSNKPHDATTNITKRLLGRWPFEIVCGHREGMPAKPNPASAMKIIEELGLEPNDCVYVGDSKVDMLTGKSAGMFTVGVTWGFRDREELQQNGADQLIDQPMELLDFLD
ncbi:HAD family hydrolase [Poriferisphaera sp. WC338]|uniref:HAD family hydrolase n=1 Tax=Poriferisphaera sp. WC338 TaxID=3425129 RepID=UPI003D817039